MNLQLAQENVGRCSLASCTYCTLARTSEPRRRQRCFLEPQSCSNTRTCVTSCDIFGPATPCSQYFHQSALRQMIYLSIKELAVSAEDVIMVTSSIMKDMQPNSEVIYRPNAIRALCRIIDVRSASTLFTCAHILFRHSLRWYKA